MHHPRLARRLLSRAAILLCLWSPLAHAAGVVSECSEPALRAAMAGGGTVTFSCSGTITLTSTLVITDNTTLDGTGQQVVLSGGGAVRVLENRSVFSTLRRLTISHGVDTQVAGVKNAGNLSIEDCTVADHVVQPDALSPAGGAAGIYHESGTLTLKRCAIVRNRTAGPAGPANVSAFKSGSHLQATDPTNPSVWITNCTFSGNDAPNGHALLFGYGVKVLMDHCTVADNTGLTQAGPVPTGNRAILSSCVFGGNEGLVIESFTDVGFSLFQDSIPAAPSALSRTGLDPQLGALGDQGGATPTHLPSATSPLVNRADPQGAVNEDQRGAVRPNQGVRDIGAVEVDLGGSPILGVVMFPTTYYLNMSEFQPTTITLSRTGSLAREVSVRVFSTNGTAVAGSDFQALDTVVVFAPGATSQSVVLTPINDTEVENKEFLNLQLEVLTAGFIPAFSPLPISITSDEEGYYFVSAGQVVSEGGGPVSVSVGRVGNLDVAGTTSVSVKGGTASWTSDFVSTAWTASFAANQSVSSISIALVDDNLREPSETINLGLNSTIPSNKVHVVTIQDNDPIPTGFLTSHLKVAEGSGRALLVVERFAVSTGAVSVAYATVDGTAVGGEDFIPTSGVLNFAVGERMQNLEIPLVVDNVVEGEQSFSVQLTPLPGWGEPVVGSATVVIQDAVHTLASCTQSALFAAAAQGGTIRFACDGAIVLDQSLDVTQGLLLDANGHQVSLEIATVAPLARLAAGNTLDVWGMTWQGGFARGDHLLYGLPGGPGKGGAVSCSNAVFRARNASFRYNVAMGGENGTPINTFAALPSGPGQGGAVHAERSAVQLEDCEFTGNKAQSATLGYRVTTTAPMAAGGALFALDSSLHLENCLLAGNEAVGGLNYSRRGDMMGGAIKLENSRLVMRGCEVRDNKAWDLQHLSVHAMGGGIHVDAKSNATLRECRLTGNLARGGNGGMGNPSNSNYPGRAYGGGLWNAGRVDVRDCTFDANEAVGGAHGDGFQFPGFGSGGGVWNQGQLTLVNATFHANVARGGDGDGTAQLLFRTSGYGGGLSIEGGIVEAWHCTWTQNAARWSPGSQLEFGLIAVQQGGAIHRANGLITLENCIYNRNEGSENVWGSVQDAGHNLSSDGTGASHPTSLANTDALTGALRDLGGRVPVVPLLAGSPAIDVATVTHYPPADARGVARPHGAAPDLGAFEYNLFSQLFGSLLLPGHVSPTSAVVRLDGVEATWLEDGRFRLTATNYGPQVVTVFHPDWVFMPPSRTIHLPVTLDDLLFTAHRRQTLEFTPAASGSHALNLFGQPDQLVELFATPSLSPANWSSLGTHRIGADGILGLPVDPAQPTRIFRFDIVPQP